MEGLRCCELPESVSTHSIWVQFHGNQRTLIFFAYLALHPLVIIMWAIQYHSPKLKSIPITHSADKPPSTMANLPARHCNCPNTHPAFHQTTFNYGPLHRQCVGFGRGVPLMPPVIELRATKVDIKHIKTTPPRAQRRY